MADNEIILKRLAMQGITPLNVDESHSALEQMLQADLVQATVLDADWRRMRLGLGGGRAAASRRSRPHQPRAGGRWVRTGGSASEAEGRGPSGNCWPKRYRSICSQILSMTEMPDPDTPLDRNGTRLVDGG